MTSQIDPTAPVQGTPTTASVRANFQTAHDEITALQSQTAGALPEAPADANAYARQNKTWVPALPLAGGTLTGPLTLAADPTAPLHPATKEYVDAAAAHAFNDVGRNLAHNSMWRVQQRGAGPWTTGGPTFTADRWFQYLVNSTISTTLAALVDADRTAIGDEAAVVAMQAVFTGTAGAGDFIQIQHRAEGVQRFAGKTVTLSFWARATSGTPRLGYSMLQRFGAGGSPSADVAGIGSAATAPLSTTWTRYTATIAVPTSIGKTFGTTAGTDFSALVIWLTSGATNNPTAGNIGVQSGTVQLWGVQLEIGSVATPLEKPDLRAELANCQRFYQVGILQFYGYAAVGGSVGGTVSLPVPMRAGPTIAPAFTTTNATSPNMSNLGSNSGLNIFATATATGTVLLQATYSVSADI